MDQNQTKTNDRLVKQNVSASHLTTENLPGLEHNEHDNVGMPCEQDIMHCVCTGLIPIHQSWTQICSRYCFPCRAEGLSDCLKSLCKSKYPTFHKIKIMIDRKRQPAQTTTDLGIHGPCPIGLGCFFFSKWKRLSVHVPPVFPKLYRPLAVRVLTHTHTQTHTLTAPILWPRPLTREVTRWGLMVD